jgi:transcriptional regulator with XRE-family HTH domain
MAQSADPGQLARLMFGAALRYQRLRMGLSLRQLGKQLHYDFTRLSRAETGEHLPPREYVRALDTLLGTDGLLTQLLDLLIRKSNIAYRTGDHLCATELAAAAQHEGVRVNPKIIALACQQEARGWAIVSDYEHCAPKLDEAAALLTGTSETAEGVPLCIQNYDTNVLEEQAATCYRDVGRVDQAISIFQRKIDELPCPCCACSCARHRPRRSCPAGSCGGSCATRRRTGPSLTPALPPLEITAPPGLTT